MTAPDFATLFDPETPVETACVAIMQADGKQCFPARSLQKDIPTPRTEVELQLGRVTGHRALPIINGQPQGILDAWDAVLIWRSITARNKDAQFHAANRADLRVRMQIFQGQLNAVNLPYHVVTSILEAGTHPSIENGLGLDISEIHFNCIVGIRSNAWPAS